MTLLKAFNEALKELPSISKKLENSIMIQEWSEEKSKQAVKIVRQLQKTNLLEFCKEASDILGYNFVNLSQLTITISPSECCIKGATTFEPEIFHQAKEYFEDLLRDMNCISEDVKFSLSGHNYDDKECTFFISWEI